MDFAAIINNKARFAAMLEATTPLTTPAATGFAKLLIRFGVGTNATTAARGVGLTAAEEAALLTKGAKYIFKLGARIFIFAAFVDTVVSFISGEPHKELVDRFGIVIAHLIKGSSKLIAGFTIIEQGYFAVTGQNTLSTEQDNIEFATEPILPEFPPETPSGVAGIDGAVVLPFPVAAEEHTGLQRRW